MAFTIRPSHWAGKEVGAPPGNAALHVGTRLTEQGNQLGRLVRGDAAGDTENDVLFF